MNAKAVGETFWNLVAQYLKNTLEYVGSLGESRAETGQVWIAEVDGIRPIGATRALGPLTNLSWPVFGPDGDVYALGDNGVVRLTGTGEQNSLPNSSAPWVKLVGVGHDSSILGIMDDPPFGKIAILSPKGELTVGASPVSAEDRERQAALLQESRTFADGRRLSISYSARGGRGSDIFIAGPHGPTTNLSDCGDDACGQPSISPDGKWVAWIRSKSR
jgi:hypothetical protein